MESLPNKLKILKYIDENGPINFTQLVKSEKLDLSRNTITKYIKILREENLIDIEYKGRKIFNYTTSNGKLQLEKYLGKDDLTHRLNAYSLYEQKVKGFRDGFIERFGQINDNILLIDCVENFLKFKQYDFDKKLPSEDFCYYLAFYISRYDIQYCKSQSWLRTKSRTIRLTQKEFFKKYHIDPIEITYFCKEWKKFHPIFLFYDNKENLWVFSPTSYLYELIMWQITTRTRRGTLQEMIFENFSFSLSNEATKIAHESIQALHLQFDFRLNRHITNFVSGMLDFFLRKRKGYSSPWLSLPNDKSSLLELSTDLEIEVNNKESSLDRKLEIYRTLMRINEKLENHQEIIFWGEKFLEMAPENVDVLTSLSYYYYDQENYEKFLDCIHKLKREIRYDMILKPQVINYYLEINKDIDKALEEIIDAEKFLINNQYAVNFYPLILYYKVKVYLIKKDFSNAKITAEKSWEISNQENYDLFELLVEIYKNLKEWEKLEDFCRKAYRDNPFEPRIYGPLYYSYLKRNSKNKAQEFYTWIRENFPETTNKLDDIRRTLKKNQ